MRLKSKRVIVTGGASGIGRSVCEVFTREGASVVIGDIDSDGGQETVSIISKSGGESFFVQTDVSNEESVENFINTSVELLGGIDIVVNDAAAFIFGTVQDTTREDWEKVFGVNVIGPANIVSKSLPYLKECGNGSVVNIASVSGFVAQPEFVPYNTSKGALLQLTRCLAMDLAQYGIRVNGVCPASTHTPALDRHIVALGVDKERFLQDIGTRTFLKRIGLPEEVANVALFLASSEASYVTGTHVVVDGGVTASPFTE